MKGTRLSYAHDGETMLGWLELPDETAAFRGAVVIAHTWAGLGDFERGKAAQLAELGFGALAADLFGGGRHGSDPDENANLIAPYLADRALLAGRMRAAVGAVSDASGLTTARVTTIGFCFGGLASLELARSGSEHAGSVAFHGLLPRPDGTDPSARRAPVLVLHGHRDPLAPPADIAALAQELEQSDADWQIHVYGRAGHAFTNPAAADPDAGMAFDADADRRSWRALIGFLDDVSERAPA